MFEEVGWESQLCFDTVPRCMVLDDHVLIDGAPIIALGFCYLGLWALLLCGEVGSV